MSQESNPIEDPRLLAVTCLAEVERHSLLVPEAMARLPFKLSDEDCNFAHEVCYGTFRFLPGLMRVLQSFCKPRKLPPRIRWLLLSSLYQLHFMRVPDYAMLNEANKLAVAMKFKGLKPLVNGVLRNAIRKGKPRFEELTPQAWLLPDWLAELLGEQYGSEVVEGWLATWQDRSQTSYWTIHETPLQGDTPSEILPNAWRHSRPLSGRNLVEEGIYLQNESSQAVSEMACRLKPESVLDLCAAPGGKTCYMARFGNIKRIVAVDQSSSRLVRMRQNRDRLGLEFEINQGDGLTLEVNELYDLVLIDAPCSGLGIIGRHPEIKFLKKGPADDKLRTLQADLLLAGWQHVKPGGHLLFTVCSLDKQEVPTPMDDARGVIATSDPDFIKKLPCQIEDVRFFFSPTPVFDGFAGMLLRKPV